MSSYALYQQARDAAWEVLLRCECTSLPIDVQQTARRLGITVLPYPKEEAHLLRLLPPGSGASRSLRIRGSWHIFLNAGEMGERRARFALAHEIGHVVLRHDTQALSPGIRAFKSPPCPGDVDTDTENLLDYAADIFALRLLAPACVLHGLRLYREQEIADRCALPPVAASLRAERMVLLAIRSAFFSHPLEKRVYSQFYSYIAGKSPSADMPPSPEITVTYPPLSRFRDGGIAMEEYRTEAPQLTESMKLPSAKEADDMPPPPPPVKRALRAVAPPPLRLLCLRAFALSSGASFLAFLFFI